MLKCVGYRFKSFHGTINGSRIDSDKLLFSYISDEEENLTGWETHMLIVKVENVSRIFGVDVMRDTTGNLIAPELEQFRNKPIFLSCTFDEKGKAKVNRVIVDTTHPQNDKK